MYRPISCRRHSYVTRSCARIVVAETHSNKRSETGKIHIIRDKMYCCAFGCQNRNANNFYRILLSKMPFEAKHKTFKRTN